MTAPAVLGNGQLRLDEVYLSGSTGQGPAVVGGIALLADGHGLTVLGPQPSSIRTMPWGRASTFACHRETQLPDGRPAVILEVDIDGHALRFLVPQASLGGEGAGALEERLTALSHVPIAADPPVAIGGEPVAPAAPGQAAAPTRSRQVDQSVSAGAGQPAPGVAPPGVLPQGVLPPGALPPATGGTIAPTQGFSAGQYVQSSRRRVGRKAGRRARITAVLVVVLVAGGAAAYVVKTHHGDTTGSGPITGDALAAAEVNLAPGDLPGWKGIPGTIAGAIGAFGFDQTTGGASSGSGTANRSGVIAKATTFSRCMHLPASDANAALAALGFSQGLATVPGETALSSSPVFEDPSLPATSAESSVIVLGSAGEQTAAASVFADPRFASCYSRFLTAVVPSLVGGATSAIPFAYASVHEARVRSSAAGVSVRGFNETFYRKDRPVRAALSGGIDVMAGGRIIAVLQTIESHSFPVAEGLKLFDAVEQNVAGESST
jgi:hypothetical protein